MASDSSIDSALNSESVPASDAACSRSGLRRWEALGLAATLAVACLLRLGWPSISQFRLDEAHISALALTLAEGQALPLYGTQSSVGVNLPPWGNYLYAIPFVVSRSPLAAVLFTGLLNVAGVVLCWWLARRYWGRLAGLLAGLLYGMAPWAVFFSRQIWQPDLMAPLALACITTAILGFFEGRRWAIVAHLALLSVTLQVHFSGVVLVPITLALAIAYRKQVSWPAISLGCLVALLLGAPYAVYLWRDRVAIADIVRQATGGGARLSGETLRYWWMMMTGDGVQSLLGETAAEVPFAQGPWLSAMAGAVFVFSLAGALRWLAGRGQDRWEAGRVAAAVVAGWWLLPLLLFLVHSTPVHIHYMAVSLPAPALLAGSLLGGRSRESGVEHPYLLAMACSLAALEAGVCLALLGVMGQRATPGGFGFPLDQQLRAVAEAEAQGPPYIVLTPGDNATHDEWAAIFDIHLWGQPHSLVDGRHAALFVESGATLIATEGVDAALATYDLAGAVTDWTPVEGREGDAPVFVGRIAAGALPDLVPPADPVLLANGTEWLGYDIEGKLVPGETVIWRLGWRVATLAYDPETTYHVFSHLLAPDGPRVAQRDSSTIPTSSWQVGDVIVQAFTLTIPEDAPAGPYTMAVGMYTFPDLEAVPVVSAAGEPIAHSTHFGPLQDR